MWLLMVLLVGGGPTSFVVPLTPTESVTVTAAGAGRPVVMIPGLFDSRYAFRKLVPLLADAGYRALVIEPLDTLGIRDAVVMGHAVSASIALRLALRRPDLVAGVVALDGGLAETAATKGFRKAMAYAPWMRLFGGKGLLRKKIRAHMVEGYTADAARDLGATLDAYEGMVRSREPQALRPALGDIRCPVRLVAGAAPHVSAVPSEEIALMRAHLPMFAIDSLPDVGHFAFEENPAALVRVVGRLWVSRTLTALQVTR